MHEGLHGYSPVAAVCAVKTNFNLNLKFYQALDRKCFTFTFAVEYVAPKRFFLMILILILTVNNDSLDSIS